MFDHTAMRRETIGNATLYLGDCRELLAELQADAVISDPPYGIGYMHSGGGRGVGARRNHGKPIAGDDEDFDPTPLLRFPVVLLFGADHYRKRLPDGGTLICWDKHTGIGPNDSFADAEFAWTNAKLKRNVIRFLWKGVACEKAGEENGKRYHPTTKPQGVMRWCIDQVAKQATTILDPYMGSGSTGVAALELGKRFVGVEIDPAHFDVACERIERAQRQARLDLVGSNVELTGDGQIYRPASE